MYCLHLFLIFCVTLCIGAPRYWLDQTLAYQDNLQQDVPINERVLFISHQAFNYLQVNFTGNPIQRPPPTSLNQVTYLYNQLDIGVRAINLEVHYLDQLQTTPKLFCCKGSGFIYDFCFGKNSTSETTAFCSLAGIDNYGNDTGCWPNSWDRSFFDTLGDIAAWQSENPNEFLFIQMTWPISTASGDDEISAMNEFSAAISNYWTSAEIFSPNDKEPSSWPTTSELISSGKKIMFFNGPTIDSTSFGPLNAYPSYAFVVNLFQGYPECTQSILPAVPLPKDEFISLMEDTTSFTSAFNGPSLVGVWSDNSLSENMACGFSFSMDNIDYTTASRAVWSWAVGEPANLVSSTSQFCAYISGTDGRWYTMPCHSQTLSWACKSDTDQYMWAITGSGTQGGTPPVNECPSGYSYAAPINAAQNRALLEAASSENVWIHPVTVSQVALPQAPPLLPLKFLHSQIPAPEPAPMAPVTPRPHPQEPRFCGLSATATTFDCNWQFYAENAVSRTAGALVGVGIGLFVSCIFGCVIMLCCFGCIGREKEDDYGDDGADAVRFRDKLRPLIAIPMILILVGIIIAFIGNSNYSSTIASAQTELTFELGKVKSSQQAVNSLLFNLAESNISLSQQQDLQTAVTLGVSTLTDNVNNFVGQVNTANTVRTAILITMCIGSFLISIVGIVLAVQKRHKALLGVLIIINFFVFLTIVTFTVHALVNTGATDVCAEVNYQGGMFDLWQKLAMDAFEKLENITDTFIANLETTGCQQYEKMCNVVSSGVPFQLCGYFECSVNLYLSLGSFSLIDTGGTIVNVSQCPTTCVNPDLRNATAQYETFMSLYEDFLEVKESVASLLEGVASESTRAFLHSLICDNLTNSLQVVYTGCGVLLSGQLLIMLCFFYWGW